MHWKIAYVSFFLITLSNYSVAQNYWTNTAGRAFSAKLIELTDTHATFVMAASGETNKLAIGALSPASQAIARRISQLPEIPNCLQSTFNICSQDLKRICNLHADGRLDDQQYSKAQGKILSGFYAMFKKHNLPVEQYPALKARLLSASKKRLL